MTLLSDAIQKIKLFFGPDSRPLLREMDVIKFYGNMFSLENIDKLTWKKFLGFLDDKNNHHWSYLFRVQNHFNESVEELIPAVKILLDESMDITERLRLTSRGAEYGARGGGPGVYTPIMIVVHPNEYAVYNGVVIDAVNKLIEEGEIDFGVEKLTKSNFVRTYKKFNEFAKKLANENGLTLWELDWVWFSILNPDREPTLGHDDEPFFYDSTNLRIQNYPEEPEIRVPKLELPLNLILYGPVGTGKTTIANTLGRGIVNGRITNFTQLENLISGKEEFEDLKANGKEYSENIEIVTFHKSYGYEQFIEGIKPEKDKDGNLSYDYNVGVFKDLSNRAREELKKDNTTKFVLIIDEINRGDISRIFGELITLVEEDKRYYGDSEKGMSIKLPYTNTVFSVPGNLFIIGTMNTTDKSIALIDLALRRRFHFIEIPPNTEKLMDALDEEGSEDNLKEAIIRLFKGVNEQLIADDKEEFGIGQAYFMGISSKIDFLRRWNYKILPLLEEYYYDDKGSLISLLGNIFKNTGETWNAKKNIKSYGVFNFEDKFIDSILSE